MSAPLISVEVHLSAGLPNFSIVGLPEKALKESKDRVRSAILNSNFDFPMQRITVNLAPADLPKQGGRFDLAIALGILIASQQVKTKVLAEYEFAAELALDGHLRSIKAALPFAIATQAAKRKLIIAIENSDEVKLARHLPAFSAQTLLEVCAHLQNETTLPNIIGDISVTALHDKKDLNEVKGQVQGKRALEIAAVGNHSILFYGPPGTGKTMLAQRLMSIMPELNEEQALEVAAIYSLSRGKFDASQWQQRPFRAPHHSASTAAMVGGGRPVQPGEISLAHHGVLFLDEFPEFNRAVLEALAYLELLKDKLHVIHQTGKTDLKWVGATYFEHQWKAEVYDFIYDMENIFSISDYVICRAGASSVAELALLGKACLFVPYPYAANNHQEENARILEKKGACRILLDWQLNGQELAKEICYAYDHPRELEEMRKKIISFSRPYATQAIVDQLKTFLEGSAIRQL